MPYYIFDHSLYEPSLKKKFFKTAEEAIEYITPTMNKHWPKTWFIRKVKNQWQLGAFNTLRTDSFTPIVTIMND